MVLYVSARAVLRIHTQSECHTMKLKPFKNWDSFKNRKTYRCFLMFKYLKTQVISESITLDLNM